MNATRHSLIECETHGPGATSVVCVHHLCATDRVVGFIENSTDPDDLQAWCNECERMFLEEGSLTERFEEFNDRAIVCVACYALLKERHSDAFPV